MKHNIRILYDNYIKPSLDTPFLNDDISFTLFNFKDIKTNDCIDKEKLNNLSYLVSYAYIFNKQKVNTVYKQDLQNAFFNFYKSKLNETNVLTMKYFENTIIPRHHSKMRKDEFNQIFTDIKMYNLKDLQQVIYKCFDDLIKADEILSISDNCLEENNYDHLDFSKSKNIISLYLFINKNNLNNHKLNKFINKIKSTYTKVSNCLSNLDLLDTKFTTNEDLLNLFSNEDFFSLDYLSLTLNKVSYSLCYLIFLFKVLKNIEEYKIYVETNYSKFINIYNDTVFNYHKYINDSFNNVSKALNSFVLYQKDMAIMDFKYSDTLKSFHFRRNKSDYLAALNKINNIKILLANKKTTNVNYENFLYFFNQYQYAQFNKIELPKPSNINSFDSYMYPNIVLKDFQEHLNFKKKKIRE